MCLRVGGRVEQCAVCGLMFSSTVAGDKHRTGEHGVKSGPDRRRCLSVDEMAALTLRSGEPWFTSKIDRAGCVIWVRNQPGTTHWRAARDDSDDGVGVPVGDGPGTVPARSEEMVGR